MPRLAAGRQPRPADGLLASAVAAGRTAVVCQVLAGMGGVGKTQLAANLATGLWAAGQVDLLVWVTATNRTSIVDDYARAAAEIRGTGDDSDPRRAAHWFLDWLAATPVRWLVVLDDLTDPADLAGWWPPDTRSGRTVVTTRRRDTALLAGRQVIDVGVFTTVEARAYLAGQIGDDAHRFEEADQLASDLGYLPIALAQAAAYLLDLGLTCTGYRTRLHERRLGRVRPDTLPDEQQLAVAETWDLSIQLADTATEGLATPILRLAALLDPNGIPTSLFTAQAVVDICRQQSGEDADANDVVDAIHVLHRLSLADTTRDPDTGVTLIRVHALVQRVAAETTPSDQIQLLAHSASEALIAIWPEFERDSTTTRLGQLLRANTAALTIAGGEHLWHTGTGEPGIRRVLFRAGDSLGQVGQVAAARDHYQFQLAKALEILGPNHPETLTTQRSLAYWRGEAGDAVGAVAAFEQVLADVLRVLGPDHPDTLTTRHDLAYWRGEAGDAVGAVAAFEQVLADVLRVLGPDHPDTLTTRHDLARWRGEAGDTVEAVAAFEQVLADRLRVLGPDHLDTLTTRHHLAHWRGVAGDAVGAVADLAQVLADALRVLGPDHPDTLAARHSLAHWRAGVGDAVGAVAAFEQVLADRLRVLGPDHPHTLETVNNLAFWRRVAGDPADAGAEQQP
ncbi:tetratricopeptide repeat protein [Actinoplanes sp. NPDC049668]|uniref:tetratricopeptide repeat protein n=1 Tax=unclassified Actinoplanes TaxID=2626549 RepID=UPI0033B497AB